MQERNQINPEQNPVSSLPEASVELLGNSGFKIELQKMVENVLHDQSSAMTDATGCFNSPGGPTC